MKRALALAACLLLTGCGEDDGFAPMWNEPETVCTKTETRMWLMPAVGVNGQVTLTHQYYHECVRYDPNPNYVHK